MTKLNLNQQENLKKALVGNVNKNKPFEPVKATKTGGFNKKHQNYQAKVR